MGDRTLLSLEQAKSIRDALWDRRSGDKVWTQAKLALKVGVSESTLSKILKRKKPVPQSMVMALLHAVGAPADPTIDIFAEGILKVHPRPPDLTDLAASSDVAQLLDQLMRTEPPRLACDAEASVIIVASQLPTELLNLVKRTLQAGWNINRLFPMGTDDTVIFDEVLSMIGLGHSAYQVWESPDLPLGIGYICVPALHAFGVWWQMPKLSGRLMQLRFNDTEPIKKLGRYLLRLCESEPTVRAYTTDRRYPERFDLIGKFNDEVDKWEAACDRERGEILLVKDSCGSAWMPPECHRRRLEEYLGQFTPTQQTSMRPALDKMHQLQLRRHKRFLRNDGVGATRKHLYSKESLERFANDGAPPIDDDFGKTSKDDGLIEIPFNRAERREMLELVRRRLVGGDYDIHVVDDDCDLPSFNNERADFVWEVVKTESDRRLFAQAYTVSGRREIRYEISRADIVDRFINRFDEAWAKSRCVGRDLDDIANLA